MKKQDNNINISSILPTLSTKKLRELRAQIDFLLNSKPEDPTSNYQLFYDTFTNILAERTNAKYPPYYISRKNTNIKKKIEKVTDYLDDYLKRTVKPIRKVYYKQLYVMFTTLLINDMVGYTPIEFHFVLNCYLRFPALMDKAYPGYAESGLLRVVFTKNLNE